MRGRQRFAAVLGMLAVAFVLGAPTPAGLAEARPPQQDGNYVGTVRILRAELDLPLGHRRSREGPYRVRFDVKHPDQSNPSKATLSLDIIYATHPIDGVGDVSFFFDGSDESAGLWGFHSDASVIEIITLRARGRRLRGKARLYGENYRATWTLDLHQET